MAQLDRMGDTFLTFALTVLPALLTLGLTSYSRLADLAVHDAYYAHAVMRQAGQPHSRWHHLGHTATAVAAVVGVITGAFLGVLGFVVTPLATSVLAAGATVVAVTAFAGLLADQERRWRHADASLQSHFLPDGTPAMTVTTFDDRAPGRGRATLPALAGADSGRTEQGKAAR